MASRMFERLKTQGTKVYYLHVCARKLWWFARQITMEHTSDLVALGRLLHQHAYRRSRYRDLTVDGLIRIDRVQQTVIREIKYSPKLAYAARAQLLYYLYYMKQRGIPMEGILSFPRQRRQERVQLRPEHEPQILEWLHRIRTIESMPTPPKVDFMPICRRCAYLMLCWG